MYIVVEGEDPGFDIFVTGHALARNEDALERLAEKLSVRPLLEFFSADRNSMALLLDQGAGNPAWTEHLPQPQWFLPEDGLRTVRSLLDFVPEGQAEKLPVLEAIREKLVRARARGLDHAFEQLLAVAHAAAQAERHFHQQLVAGGVAQRVVDHLEAVKIDQQQRHLVAQPAAELERPLGAA